MNTTTQHPSASFASSAASSSPPMSVWDGHEGFWLKVRGDSMTRQGGVTFPEGMLIFVALGVAPTNGGYVLAQLGDDVTFRQYVADGNGRALVPLNVKYPVQQLDGRWHLLGTVVDAKWPKGVF